MSLQGLVSGSECAAPTNPLSQVLKHTDGDRSLQQDRVAGPSSSRLHHLPGSSAGPSNERDIAMARQFFNGGTPQLQGPSPFTSSAPHFLPSAGQARFVSRAGALDEAWGQEQQNNRAASQQQQQQQQQQPQQNWSQEFGVAPQMPLQQGFSQDSRVSDQSNGMIYNQTPYGSQNMVHASNGLYGTSMPMSSNAYAMNQQMPAMQQYGKGKGKLNSADFESAFAEASKNWSEVGKSSVVEVADDTTTETLEDAMRKASLEDSQMNASAEFKKIWEELQNSDAPPPKEDLAKWEAEFNQLQNAQRDGDFDFGAGMQSAWESGLGNYDENDHQPDGLTFDDAGMPILGPYQFEKDNKYLDPSMSRQSPLADAKALLEKNGSLSDVSLALEAAIQMGELGEGGYEAWILLGETRNMDEREEAGMRALVEGVKVAQSVGAQGAGMLSLAISYTNEGYSRASYTMLLRWIRERFPDHHIPDEVVQTVSKQSPWHAHEVITKVFLDLVRLQHDQGLVEPDVQIGLGVLFYTNTDYERAKDCFESALVSRPNDYLLWNRMGSCLSNGNKPEEALGAYRQALHLRPTYTRAIYNVGVACLNIGAYKEAAEHFLTGLSLQNDSAGESSEQLWTTLRRAVLAMDRKDLAELAKANAKTSLDVFRKEGFEF